MRRYFILMVTALALGLAVSAASIADAKPASTTVAALTGSAGVHVGDNYTVTGSGFAPGSLVPLEISEADGCCIALNMVADGSGNFTYAGYVRALGAYGVRAFTQRNGGRWRVAASWSFDVYQ